MTDFQPQFDWWRVPAFALWLLLFAAGAIPEEVFHLLRDAGHVTTAHAMVNSPHMVTLGLACFMGWFVYTRSLEAGCGAVLAGGKGLQMFFVGLIAFSSGPLESLAQLDDLRNSFGRHVILWLASVKLLAWSYAFSVIVRYYFLSGPLVFQRMICLFPSTYSMQSEDHKKTGVTAHEHEPSRTDTD